MLTEFRKSIDSIFSERIASPFYGTLTISWLIWNWKIIYLTLFISENKITTDKINYIISNYSDIHILAYYPLLSTLLLLTLIPFLSNSAFWLSMTFNKWKIDQKNIIEKRQLLTLEQSINIREEIRNQEEKFEKLLQKKDEQISILNAQLTPSSETNIGKKQIKGTANVSENKYLWDYSEFERNTKVSSFFDKIIATIKKNLRLEGIIPDEIIDFYTLNEIIAQDLRKQNGYFELTDKGNYFFKQRINSKLSEKK